MNLNQSAHGDREFGFICTRLRMSRKVVVGHWQDAEVQDELGAWTRAAAAWHDWQGAKFARFGDNMREVAVTEGDKVEAQIRFGYSVNGYGVGDLVEHVQRGDRRRGRQARRTSTTHSYTVAESLRKGGRQRNALRDGRADRAGHAGLPRGRRLQGASPPPSRICTGWSSCPAWRCSG